MRSDEVKVSIITPCLNSEKTIRQTIESVLNQTYFNIEYIIIDGGSTDSTLSIIEEYIPLFKGRLRYISEKDKGIYDAMNKGIKMSCGQLIGIVNSDDYYEDETIEKVVRQYKNGCEQIIYGYARLVNKDRIVGICKESHKSLHDHMIPHNACFVTREVYRKYGLYLTAFKITSDYELMLRVEKKCVSFVRIPEILVNYRIGGASAGRRMLLEKNIIRLIYRYISVGQFAKLCIEYFCLDTK